MTAFISPGCPLLPSSRANTNKTKTGQQQLFNLPQRLLFLTPHELLTSSSNLQHHVSPRSSGASPQGSGRHQGRHLGIASPPDSLPQQTANSYRSAVLPEARASVLSPSTSPSPSSRSPATPSSGTASRPSRASPTSRSTRSTSSATTTSPSSATLSRTLQRNSPPLLSSTSASTRLLVPLVVCTTSEMPSSRAVPRGCLSSTPTSAARSLSMRCSSSSTIRTPRLLSSVPA